MLTPDQQRERDARIADERRRRKDDEDRYVPLTPNQTSSVQATREHQMSLDPGALDHDYSGS